MTDPGKHNSSITDRDLHPSPFIAHSRHWESFTYIYPVISRRSKGLSIGVNLNPDTICNFDCVYCQVEKVLPASPITVDTQTLHMELGALLADVVSGRFWEHPRFTDINPVLRRLNDIAFSGNGEPTSAACFPEVVDMVVRVRQQHRLDDTKIVLITNATLLQRPEVEQAIRKLDANNGEVWAKLDAGTQAYYEKIDRSAVPLKRVLENILACGRNRPIVIQSMFLKLHGQAIEDRDFQAYADRVAELIEAGCRIKLIQLYTLARRPQESYVSALSDAQLAELADKLRRRVDAVSKTERIQIEVFGSGH